MADETIPPWSWFGTNGERVSVYKDGTVEIQAEGSSYRASPQMWVEKAAEFNRGGPHGGRT